MDTTELFAYTLTTVFVFATIREFVRCFVK